MPPATCHLPPAAGHHLPVGASVAYCEALPACQAVAAVLTCLLHGPPPCRYNAFVAEETKRLWHWSRRYPKEADVWAAVPHFVGCELLCWLLSLPWSSMLAWGCCHHAADVDSACLQQQQQQWLQ